MICKDDKVKTLREKLGESFEIKCEICQLKNKMFTSRFYSQVTTLGEQINRDAISIRKMLCKDDRVKTLREKLGESFENKFKINPGIFKEIFYVNFSNLLKKNLISL